MPTYQFEAILDQVKRMPPSEQLKLIQRITEYLSASESQQQTSLGLVYGKYRRASDRMSTEEDFRTGSHYLVG